MPFPLGGGEHATVTDDRSGGKLGASFVSAPAGVHVPPQLPRGLPGSIVRAESRHVAAEAT
jgi:hypothetical protein